MNNTEELKQKEKVVMENLDCLVRFALFRTGDIWLAEDIVQDAVVRFIEHRHPPISPGNLRAYLFRIVYNLSHDRLRHIVPTTDIPLDSINEHSASPEQQLDSDEVERINSILESLPEKQREVIRMNVVDDLSFTEISKILSVPASTLKSRFRIGMDKLKKLYFNEM